MDFGGHPYMLDDLLDYTKTAARLGFTTLCANDHLVFSVPWLDGPTALAVAIRDSGTMTLATTVALAVVRGPVPVAKSLGAIDRLSGGRALVVVGPGSSPRDYESVGVDFEERWQRLDEAVLALRALWGSDAEPFVGRFYSTEEINLQPAPAQPGGPPLWIGSWGSAAGLRRVARLGDGWLASAYNITPAGFAAAGALLREELAAAGRPADGFPHALVTMWTWITEDRAEAERILTGRLAPLLKRDPGTLRGRVCVGPAGMCAEMLSGFAEAGCRRVHFWPLGAERRQIDLIASKVLPGIRS